MSIKIVNLYMHIYIYIAIYEHIVLLSSSQSIVNYL